MSSDPSSAAVSREGIWPLVHRERRALISDLQNLSAEQWRQRSWCHGWDIHDVLAHLIDDATTTRLGFVWGMVLARGDFDRLNARGVARHRQPEPRQTLDRFAAVSGNSTSAPVPLVTRLVEVFVHGEDIRRPLGIRYDYPADWVMEAVSYQAKTSIGMGGGKERVQGVQLSATDTSVTTTVGNGDTVRAPAISLLLAASGRPVPAAEFTGPGATAFLGRI